jgi:hypothetical protein
VTVGSRHPHRHAVAAGAVKTGLVDRIEDRGRLALVDTTEIERLIGRLKVRDG